MDDDVDTDDDQHSCATNLCFKQLKTAMKDIKERDLKRKKALLEKQKVR